MGIDVRGKIDYALHGHKYKYCFDCFGYSLMILTFIRTFSYLNY